MGRARQNENIDDLGGETAAHSARTPKANRRELTCHEK